MTRSTSSKSRSTSRAKSLLKRAVNRSTSSSPSGRASRGSRSKRGSSSSPSSSSRSSSRPSTTFLSSIPGWVPISLGVASVCGLIYGLMQLESVSDFMDPMIHDVGEFFGLSEEEGIDSKNVTHDRIYGGVSA